MRLRATTTVAIAAALLTVLTLAAAAPGVRVAHAADVAFGAGAGRHEARVESASMFSFDRTVLRSTMPVLVEFWASYCIVCHELDGPLGVVAAEFTDRARIVRVNVTWSERIARRYGVQALPTLLVFKDGAVVSRTTGGASQQDLEELLGSVLHKPVTMLASK